MVCSQIKLLGSLARGFPLEDKAEVINGIESGLAIQCSDNETDVVYLFIYMETDCGGCN